MQKLLGQIHTVGDYYNNGYNKMWKSYLLTKFCIRYFTQNLRRFTQDFSHFKQILDICTHSRMFEQDPNLRFWTYNIVRLRGIIGVLLRWVMADDSNKCDRPVLPVPGLPLVP